MKRITFNRIMIVLAALVMMMLATAAVGAQDNTPTSYLPHFTDGRINLYDIAAPVAIYDLYAHPFTNNVNRGVLDRIEFWGLDGTGSIQKVLQVEKADITAATVPTTSPVLLASNLGYSLFKDLDGKLTLIAPNNYHYTWTPDL